MSDYILSRYAQLKGDNARRLAVRWNRLMDLGERPPLPLTVDIHRYWVGLFKPSVGMKCYHTPIRMIAGEAVTAGAMVAVRDGVVRPVSPLTFGAVGMALSSASPGEYVQFQAVK